MRRTNEQAAPQYLRAVVLVRGVHFYGFHHSYSPFLKIHFVDPRVVTRAATILQSGTVMTTRFRVFESHINYPLQFMCDFALYGCGWLDMSHVQQRTAKPSALTQLSNESNTQTKLLFPLSGHFCETRTPLEVDVAAYHIMNRHRVTARNMHHELKIPGAPLPSEPLISSVRELWEDERRQRAARGLHPSPELPVDPSEASRSAGGDWINEVRYWDDIKKRIQADDGPVIPSTSADAWQRSAMTTFQSVEALWEPAWKTWTPEKTEKLPQAPPVNVSDTAGQPEDEVFKVVITSDEQGYQGQGDGLEEDQDINERILSSQAVTQLIAETEVPRWQLDEDDEGLQQLSGGEENEYSFEEDVDTASEFGTPDQQMSTQSSPETLRQDIQEEPGSPTPSRKRASKPISNSKDLPITPQLREEVRHARLPTDDANGLLDDLASGNVLSEECVCLSIICLHTKSTS
jgi:DNA polymerase zeta